MRKLLLNKDKEKEINDVIKLLSNDKDYISIILDRHSEYVYKNIDELNNLLIEDNKELNYKKEFENIGLKIAEYNDLDGNYVIKVGYCNRLFEVVRDYIFMVMPDDNPYFILTPTYIFPIQFIYYEDLINIIPDIVNTLIDNNYAYVEK